MLNIDAIPQELKELRRWVTWQTETRNGKPTKTPYVPGDTRRAKANDPATWGTFAFALADVRAGKRDGIGFMLGNGYSGVDHDHCVTDGQIAPWALENVRLVDSYTEISPSDKGLHTLARGTLPKGRRRKGKIEMYDDRRFFTMTGNVLEGYTEINERQEALRALHARVFPPKPQKAARERPGANLDDDEIIQRAANAKNGAKFCALYAGNWQGYPSPSEGDLALCSLLAFWTGNDPEQIDRLFRRSGLMRDKWDEQHAGTGETYGQLTIAKALENGEVYTPGEPVDLWPPPVDPNAPPGREFFKCTDMGNGQRMTAWQGANIRHCAKWGSWLVWDGKRWAVDETSRIEWIAKLTVRGIYAEAARCENDETRKAIASWARASESGRSRREMIAAARSEPGIPILPDALDADPWILNVNNGTLDLRTGELKKHQRHARVSKLAPIDYSPSAECPRWILFLAQIMDNSQDMIGFLQRAVGYTLTGDVSERTLFILYGTGANGKSTFLETIRALLGEYAMSAEAKTLMRHDRGAASSDIARLKGARLVTASESERGDKIAEALVKQLTGGDRRTARRLYQNEFEYTPTDKLWLGTNHKPEISGTDRAIWDRIKLIPFTVTIPEEKQDKQLKDKLQGELSGILKWAVSGCLKWQKIGLQIPDRVRTATEGYRQDSDTLGRFIADCCVVHPNARATLKSLYDEYMDWCTDTGEPNLTKREFSAALTERGHDKRRGAGNKVEFRGIGQSAQEGLPE